MNRWKKSFKLLYVLLFIKNYKPILTSIWVGGEWQSKCRLSSKRTCYICAPHLDPKHPPVGNHAPKFAPLQLNALPSTFLNVLFSENAVGSSNRTQLERERARECHPWQMSVIVHSSCNSFVFLINKPQNMQNRKQGTSAVFIKRSSYKMVSSRKIGRRLDFW